MPAKFTVMVFARNKVHLQYVYVFLCLPRNVINNRTFSISAKFERIPNQYVDTKTTGGEALIFGLAAAQPY